MYAMLILTIAIMTPTLFLTKRLLAYKNPQFDLTFTLLCLSYAAVWITLVLASVLK